MHSLISQSVSLLAVLASLPLDCQARLQETWTPLASIPTDTLREQVTVAVTPQLLATVGGVVTGMATTNALQFYNITSNAWSKGANVPLPVNHPNAAAVGGKVYLLGAFTTTTQNGIWKAVSNSAVYDPATDAWKSLEPQPAPIRGAGAVGVYNGTIYIAGGKAGTGQASVVDVSAYEVATGKWLSLPEPATKMPGPRDHATGQIVGHKFYVLGGRDTGTNNVKGDVFILDLENLAAGWTTSKAKLPTARGGLCSGVVGTKIYTFGGEGNAAAGSRGVFNQTEVYDTATDSWTSLNPMKTPRHGTSAATVNGVIYIPGGATGQGVGDSKILEAFTP